MKKFILTVLTFFLGVFTVFSPSAALQAQAEETDVYACIRSPEVYLYEKENSSSGLFILPYTYYVKILAEGVDYCYVQYQTDNAPYKAVYGYCKTDELTFVDFVPQRPYLSYAVDATYVLEGAGNAFVGDSVLSSVTLTYAYYGDYTVGSSTYRYVTLDGKQGYLPKTGEISYELNTEYEQHAPAADNPQDTPAASTGNLPVAQIVLFARLALLAVGFVYYLLRPKREEPHSPVADDYGFSGDDT